MMSMSPIQKAESPAVNVRRARRHRPVLAATFVVLGISQLAWAQEALQRPTPLPALGRSAVTNSDTTAIVQNPANLAFLPGAELRWTGAFLNEDAASAAQGHAFALGIPFGFIPMATGFRFDMIKPTAEAADDMYGRPINYQFFTWALAAGDETASVGFAYRHSYSDAVEAHAMNSWTLGLNARPSEYFGASAVVHDINTPTSAGGQTLGVSYEVATVFRPTGSDALDLGFEASFVDDPDSYWVPRGVVDVKLPGLGRLRSDISWVDPAGDAFAPSWVGSTTLVVNMNSRHGSGEVSLGSRYGDALGENRGSPWENLTTEVAIRNFRSSSAAENFPYALRVRIEETPSTRGHVNLLRKLWRMADDEPNLAAVLLELRASPADSLAHVQELQDAIYHLQDRGKKVLCHLESASGSALYLCSVADRVLINPAGSVQYSGLQSSSFYLKGVLDKLGIRADFVRIGKHKSAPEALSLTQGTATAVEDKAILLQEVEKELTASIAAGRDLSVAELRKSTALGPFTALEAQQAKLVDGFAFDDMLEDKTRELAGQEVLFEEGEQAAAVKSRFGPQRRLAIVYVDGDMVDGRSTSFPFLGIQTAGSYTIAESLKQVRDDNSIGAVVLRVETGGGSAMAADVLWREVQLLSTRKPVIVSMGSAAASGGYYVSAPGTFIYANPLTITGSIGIFYGKMDITGLLSNIGVNVETLRTSQHADAQSPYRPFTDEEREVLKGKIQQFYNLFLRRVADGRQLSKKDVDAVGRGRVWTGRQAKEHKLVDALGGLRQALAKARVMGNLRDDAPIIELPVVKTSLLGKILGIEGVKSELSASSTPIPKELMDMARAVAPYALHPADQPLARVEFLPQLLP